MCPLKVLLRRHIKEIDQMNKRRYIWKKETMIVILLT